MNRYISTLLFIALLFKSNAYAETDSVTQNDIDILNAFAKGFSAQESKPSESEETVIGLVSKSISEMECFPEVQLKEFQKSIVKKETRDKLIPSDLATLLADAKIVKSSSLTKESLLSLSHMYEVIEYSSSSSSSSNSNSDVVLHDNGMSTADTYANKLIDPFSMVNREKLNFVYTIDCSGLLSGAIKAGADLGRNGVKVAAEKSLEASGVTFIASGIYIPALWAALNKQQGQGYLKATDSVSLLSTLGNAMIAKKINSIGVPSTIQILIIDRNKSSKSQGKIEGNINFSGNYGIASGSANASTSFGFSRTFNFYNPSAIVLGKAKLDVSYNLDSIKSSLNTYLGEIDFGRSELGRKSFFIVSDLNKNICENQDWKVKAKIKDQIFNAVIITANNKRYDPSNRVCTFEIPFTQITTTTIKDKENALTLTVEGGFFDNLKTGTEPKVVATITL